MSGFTTIKGEKDELSYSLIIVVFGKVRVITFFLLKPDFYLE